MERIYYSVRGSYRKYQDMWRSFDNLENAKKAYAEMKRDGIKNVELLKVVDTENYEYSVPIN